MNEHTKLIADLQLIQRRLSQDRDIRYMCAVGEAIEALRGIQSKAVEPKIDADTALRNQFAAAALSGFLASNETDYLIAIQSSFECADRMLAESKK